MNIAILQARMSSNRLPGKVLKPILGQPMLQRQLTRIKQANGIDKIVVATSTEASDDAIAQFCWQQQQPCFRGELANVLARFYQCSQLYPAQHYIRLTGDCPLLDATVIDNVIAHHLAHDFDYTTNAYPVSFPDGLDVEIVKAEVLANVYQHATEPDELEHVTSYIRKHSNQFKLGQVSAQQDYSKQRWTVDYPEDFQLAQRIFELLLPSKPNFNFQDVLALFKQHPELYSINQQYIS
jgi:spore coat polysaccharide biosynthesis protein SpsF